MTTLVAGPAAAMKTPARAVGGSFVRFATPPRRKSVIDETDMRKRRATTACASSWARIEQKKRNAATAETTKTFGRDHAGKLAGKMLSASVTTTRNKRTTHEKGMRMSLARER